MTKEELKTDESKYIIEFVIKDKLRKEAEEWLCNNLHSASEEDFIKAMVDIAEPREKQIQIDAKQIRALQKQNGELTDKVKELEAQIEKMKNCENCKHSTTTCECYTICTIGHYDDCKSNTVLDSLDKRDYWEN